ncbi:MAG: hypothetical protein KTR24_14595 [Saprospiraceae bacterium]|nr:hypothetical protein [Saprospiraceae bacterium]
MKNLLIILLALALVVGCTNQEQQTQTDAASAEVSDEEAASVDYVDINSNEALVATALMAAPAASRADCTVIGYNMEGEFVVMKEGTNEFICLADDPTNKGFNAACYHKNLEPFMARGRALKAQGKTAQEIFDIREEEVKAGTLDMGGMGSTLHILYGPSASYDPNTNEVEDAVYRYVVYMPWATAASTGLPERPIEPNHPWIMNPGTHRAHIMISPINGEM